MKRSSNQVKYFLALLGLCLHATGGVAQSQSALREARVAQCPEGQYAGPGTGERRFLQDPYVWFVSREFAKRFCMPEQFIDDSLTGALAIAARIKPDDRTYCGLYAGRSDLCTTSDQLLLEVYVDNRKANIPKEDPTVDYFAGNVVNSGAFFGDQGGQYLRRYRDEYKDPAGLRRPFNPPTTRTTGHRAATRFLYVGVRNGWASGSGAFMEHYYRANWVDGIDLITLNADVGFGLQANPDEREHPKHHDFKYDKFNPIQRWAIAVIKGKDEPPGAGLGSTIPYPAGYLHTIEIPHRLAQLIYATDQRAGAAFFGDIKRAMQPVAPSSSPVQP